MKVTVIIVSYNTKEILSRCLRELLEKSGEKEMEVFVVDNNNRESSVVSASITQPQRILFDFDSFTGVNLSSIDEIRLVSQGGLNVDVDLDSFSIVGEVPEITPPENIPDSTSTPEPTTFMGLLLSFGLGIFARKKR